MDLRGAVAELGLSIPVSPEAVRRAYLRGVRAHPPERDPEGFQRLREAYDLLRQFAAFPVELDDQRVPALGSVPEAADVPEPPDSPDVEAPVEAAPPIHGALESGDFERAATLLLPALQGTPTAAPFEFQAWQVLACVLGLLDHNVDRADELLDAFELWASRNAVGTSELGPFWISRWTLLRELVELSTEVDEGVLRALVQAVRTSEFLPAVSVLKRARRLDRSFPSQFKRTAPSLYRVLWPRVSSRAEWVSKPDLVGRQPIGLILVLFIVLGRGLWGTEKARPPVVPLQETTVVSAPNTTSPTLESLVNRVDQSILAGACSDVRETWPLYVAAARQESWATGARTYSKRRQAALLMCAELESVLPEAP